MQSLITSLNPLLLASAFAGLLMFGILFYFAQERSEHRARDDVKKRLEIDPARRRAQRQEVESTKSSKPGPKGLAKKTSDFYKSSDPKSLRKMQMQLMQAGYMHQNALAYFLAARIGLAIAGAIAALIFVLFIKPDMGAANKLLAIILLGVNGYFLPNMHLNRRVKKTQAENRAGFPDVLDLMIVAAEAGLTMEASIDRIAHEIERTFPTLSRHLNMAGIEVRAGRPLDEALRAFGERVGLDEVQGFATMVQQSKELGTSVSDALRVYSEEMRHKRMMAAEEKAYALPAKLSIPVTAFILPVVLGVAILPTAVRMMNQ